MNPSRFPVYGKRRDITVVGAEKVAYIDYLADNVMSCTIAASRIGKADSTPTMKA